MHLTRSPRTTKMKMLSTSLRSGSADLTITMYGLVSGSHLGILHKYLAPRYVAGLTYGYKGLLLILGLFLAYETRSVKVLICLLVVKICKI